MTEGHLRYWRVEGEWQCARDKPDPLAAIKGRRRPWWKHYGLRGQGQTKEAAREDLALWERAASLVSSIY